MSSVEQKISTKVTMPYYDGETSIVIPAQICKLERTDATFPVVNTKLLGVNIQALIPIWLESASQLKAIQIPNRAGCVSTQLAKGFQHCEWGTGTLNTLAQLSDFFFLDVAKERAGLSEIPDFFRE
jgi:hypothetical protein